jgi:hypothetical protein
MAASSGAARSPATGDRGRAGGMEASIAPALANGDLHGGEEKRGEWRAGAGNGQRKSDGQHGELTASDSMKNGTTWGRLSLNGGR